ncbi:MAG: aminotransferase class I/II-fold pyridoxal phosphate-dependent enzyme [Desulfobacterales bacterium]|nr:aminotransferase class I/II-fold pyridoxal phosphate-dependent enzyme [Desulfobacterales bacterium]
MQIPPFRLERYFAKYEFSARYLLCCSDCESFSVREMLESKPGAADEFNELWLGYTESTGNPALKKEISLLYDSIEPKQVLVHSGAEEAVFNFMNATLEKGDHVIVHWPGYQSLAEVAESIGCEVTRWNTSEDNNWALHIDFLKDNLKNNTKALVINCPHNPTGYIMPEEQFSEINRLSKEHGFIIFSDEVYRLLEYNEKDRMPSFCDANDMAVSLGVMSKTFGLAGLRIGWIATKNKAVYDKMACFKDYTTICSSAPSEFLATIALQDKDRLIRRNKKIIDDNLDILNPFFEKHQDIFNWQAPKAGPIAFPSLANKESSEEFCDSLVKKTGVLLMSGIMYDPSYKKNFRVGFGRKNMPECIEQLEIFIKNEF